MTNSKNLTGKKIETFLSKLADMTESLPTREMKEKTNQELDALITFFLDFQERMKNVPTIEETKEISSTVEKLITLVKVAESDPFLSRTLGLSTQKTSGQPKRQPLTDAERSIAKELASELKELSPQEMNRRLEDKNKFKITLLRQIATELGVKVSSKATRALIIEKISKKI